MIASVLFALLNAMSWIGDFEKRGSTATNEREIQSLFALFAVTVFDSVEKHVLTFLKD